MKFALNSILKLSFYGRLHSHARLLNSAESPCFDFQLRRAFRSGRKSLELRNPNRKVNLAIKPKPDQT